MKGEKMVKRSSLGGIRKRLSDITNLHAQIKSPAKEKENKPTFDGLPTNNYIEQLLKENAAMLKLIQEKDKVIESTGTEMQKLRVLVQKAQLQNWQLAQSNSQMLAELNLGKDRLKALQHELACKDSLFKAKITELEDKATMQPQRNALQDNATTQLQTHDLQIRESKAKKEPANDSVQENDVSKVTRNKKRRPARSRSMGPTTSQQAADKTMAENKRRCLRRQSVRHKQEEEPQIDLFQIEVANFPMTHRQPENISNSDIGKLSAKELPRSSLGRPLRRSVGKVQSYKEPSLVMKMRRPN